MVRSFSALIISAFAISTLTACGSSSTMLLPQQALNQGVQSSSLSGVRKEIGKISEAAFKELDKNGDKAVTPDEFGVSTAEQFREFNKIDGNNDGRLLKSEFTPGFFSKTSLSFSLMNTANSLFKRLDTSRDGYLTEAEMNSKLVSADFAELFKKYDKEKKGWIFNRGTKGKLSKSEFQNLFAHIATKEMFNNGGSTPAPAPAEPAPAPAEPAPAPAEPAPPAKR